VSRVNTVCTIREQSKSRYVQEVSRVNTLCTIREQSKSRYVQEVSREKHSVIYADYFLYILWFTLLTSCTYRDLLCSRIVHTVFTLLTSCTYRDLFWLFLVHTVIYSAHFLYIPWFTLLAYCTYRVYSSHFLTRSEQSKSQYVQEVVRVNHGMHKNWAE
jgi:hypothetical protein